MGHGSIRLNFICALVETWLGALGGTFTCAVVHLDSPLSAAAVCLVRKRVDFGKARGIRTEQHTHVFDQSPNMVGCLNFAEARHACESDAVVDDPKQLLIGIALHSLTCEVGSTRIHPLSRWRLSSAVDTVANAAIQAVMYEPRLNAGRCIDRRGRNSATTGQGNERVFSQVCYRSFKRGRFLQRRQIQMHQSNPDQPCTKRNNCPNDSGPHSALFRGRRVADVQSPSRRSSVQVSDRTRLQLHWKCWQIQPMRCVLRHIDFQFQY